MPSRSRCRSAPRTSSRLPSTGRSCRRWRTVAMTRHSGSPSGCGPARSGQPSGFRLHGDRRPRGGRGARRQLAGGARAAGRGRGDGGRRPAEWIAINIRHARAVLADDEREAAVRFEEALGADLDRWPFWRGRLLLAHGRWLRRHPHVTDSRAPLREARDMFDAIGASNWGDHARSELRASGERSRRRVPEARDQLTRTGAADRAARGDGLSNREIGQRLYLSHRTISTHLYRVFPKLGITSRAELAPRSRRAHRRISRTSSGPSYVREAQKCRA